VSDPVAYQLTRALDYIESLQADPGRLAVEDLDDETVRIQPTIGPIAAGVVDLLVRAGRITRILEVGTSLGYSACALGRAARAHGGSVLTIEIDERIAGIARENVAAAGLDDTVRVLVADAKTAVREMIGPFGLILQDGHKDDYLPMLDRLVELLGPGGYLVSDDVLFPVMDLPARAEGWGRAIERYNQALKGRADLRTVWLPIGDGVAVSVRI
jgi:predicted O-methyltransferase YrrM